MSLFDEIWSLGQFIEEAVVYIKSIIIGVYGLLSTIYLIISDFMQLFPPQIQALIIVATIISSFYYVYHWLKDISIAGFKI